MAVRDLIESKKYLKVRKKYLEVTATLPNRKLDARVNSLLQQQKEDNNFMENKERSPRKEKKKQKKQKR